MIKMIRNKAYLNSNSYKETLSFFKNLFRKFILVQMYCVNCPVMSVGQILGITLVSLYLCLYLFFMLSVAYVVIVYDVPNLLDTLYL